MDALAIIPARYASERFPAKALARDTGKPLIQHVVEAAQACDAIDRVVVATDDERIASAVSSFGTESVMTRADHDNGTSRLAEAAWTLDLRPDTIVVNIQGDEPEIEPAAVDGAIALLESSACDMATAAAPILSRADHLDPNVVKVVLDRNSRALYFSRAPIPYPRTLGVTPLRHIGLYVYRCDFLERYADLPSTPLEKAERLEQLRALEHGHTIGVHLTDAAWSGIDTPEQYAAFVERWTARER